MHIVKILADERQISGSNVRQVKNLLRQGRIPTSARIEYVLKNGTKIPVEVKVSTPNGKKHLRYQLFPNLKSSQNGNTKEA